MLPDAPQIVYAVEPWARVAEEMAAHFKAHYLEIAQDQEQMPLDPDYEAIAAMDAADMLHIVTVRLDEELVGYHVSVIRHHLHYRQNLCAYVDVYYISPAVRVGYVAARLFRFVEASLKARGVQKIFTGTKISKDAGRLLQRLGWRPTEMTYTKWIGGD